MATNKGPTKYGCSAKSGVAANRLVRSISKLAASARAFEIPGGARQLANGLATTSSRAAWSLTAGTKALCGVDVSDASQERRLLDAPTLLGIPPDALVNAKDKRAFVREYLSVGLPKESVDDVVTKSAEEYWASSRLEEDWYVPLPDNDKDANEAISDEAPQRHDSPHIETAVEPTRCRFRCFRFAILFILLISLVSLQQLFLNDIFSPILWMPISLSKACQISDDLGGGPRPFRQLADLQDLAACKAMCESIPSCQAVDWFNARRWCNLYTEPCIKPTASWDNASSYQIPMSCFLYNGSSGFIIHGRCQIAEGAPSVRSNASQALALYLRGNSGRLGI